MFKGSRTYQVVAKYNGGLYTWESSCGQFYFWERPSSDLLKIWKEYAIEQTGHKCLITFFARIN